VWFGHRICGVCDYVAKLPIWICFASMVIVENIYDFVNILYYCQWVMKNNMKKAWKYHLPELRVTTPTNSNKFSTPNHWRKETSS